MIWVDILQVESWATKMTQSGSGDMLAKYKLLRKLPLKLSALATQAVVPGGFQEKYHAQITRSTRDHLPVFTLVAYTKKNILEDYPHLDDKGRAAPREEKQTVEVKTVELADYVASHRILMEEKKALANSILELVTTELTISPELQAFNLVFNSSEFQFE